MVTGTHPEDVDLFDYVEGDLPPRQRAELEVHLATCAQCAEHVARVQAGRDALRGTPFLEFPAHRREEILRELATHRSRTRRAPLFTGRRLLAVLAPAAAVAAAVVALTTIETGPDEEAATPGVGGGAEVQGAPEDAQTAQARTLKAEGHASEVAEELRRKGLDARVVGDHVEVRGASRADVRRALETRRAQSLTDKDGRVEIVIVP
jgi:anti-sigma factor RsiW